MLDNANERRAALLRDALDHAPKGTRAQLARACGVTPQAVNGWVQTGRIAKEHLTTVARLLMLPLESLLDSVAREDRAEYNVEGDAVTLPTERVPVVGTAQLGDDGYWEEFAYPTGHGDGFVRYPTRDKNAYALRVKGDSMRPRIKPGEFVIIEPNTTVEPGNEVLVKTRDGRVMVKTLNFRRAGVLELASVNEDHRPITIEESDVELMHSVAGIAKAALYYRDFA